MRRCRSLPRLLVLRVASRGTTTLSSASRFAPFGFLGFRIGSSTAPSPPKIFFLMFITILRYPAAGLCPRHGYGIVHLSEIAPVMPMEGMGRWEGPLHRRPERFMLPRI